MSAPTGLHVCLINLDRSPERLAEFTQMNAHLSEDFTRFSAVDGQTLDLGVLQGAGLVTSDILTTYSVGALGCARKQRPPAGDRQRIGAEQREVAAGKMHPGQGLADPRAVRRVGPSRPHPFQEVDDRRRAPGKRGIDRAGPVLRLGGVGLV